MTDLISRSAVLDRLNYYISHSMEPGQYAYKVAHREVETAPALDVAPVVHAHWQDLRESSKDVPKSSCSLCGRVIIGLECEYKFCPNCGARMDGESEEER